LSPWYTFPIELQIDIFSRCTLQDIGSLQLVCRAFRELIMVHEHAISQKYLSHRRRGSLPSPIDRSRRYTHEPEDDVILLSDLFPPQDTRHNGADAYTFGYLRSLRRRQKLCFGLAYYLADRVMDKYLDSDSSPKSSFASKKERQSFFDRGTALLRSKLIPLM
jgi:hypothetical protein